jgi:hypothetical protein
MLNGARKIALDAVTSEALLQIFSRRWAISTAPRAPSCKTPVSRDFTLTTCGRMRSRRCFPTPKCSDQVYEELARQYSVGMRRNRVDPKSFDLTTPYGYKIPTAEMMRLDANYQQKVLALPRLLWEMQVAE